LLIRRRRRLRRHALSLPVGAAGALVGHVFPVAAHTRRFEVVSYIYIPSSLARTCCCCWPWRCRRCSSRHQNACWNPRDPNERSLCNYAFFSPCRSQARCGRRTRRDGPSNRICWLRRLNRLSRRDSACRRRPEDCLCLPGRRPETQLYSVTPPAPHPSSACGALPTATFTPSRRGYWPKADVCGTPDSRPDREDAGWTSLGWIRAGMPDDGNARWAPSSAKTS